MVKEELTILMGSKSRDFGRMGTLLKFKKQFQNNKITLLILSNLESNKLIINFQNENKQFFRIDYYNSSYLLN